MSTAKPDTEKVEKLAAVLHEIWSNQASFLLSAGVQRADGSILLPPELVGRLRKQIDQTYAQLGSQQKQSDRDQALKVIAALEGGAS